MLTDPPEPTGGPSVIGCMAQWAPGKPGVWLMQYPPPEGAEFGDTRADRLAWFRECLARLHALVGDEPVAMPHSIGCGLAGGHWPDYRAALGETAARVVLYRLP